MSASVRPRVVVSKCLGFERCRYNGDVISDDFVRELGAHVEFITICPEVEVGLGIPREPIRVVRGAGGLRLIQPATNRDVTDPMNSFCERFLGGLSGIDGFVLKSRSPSCGFKDVKVYGESGMVLSSAERHGFFGGAVVRRFPDKAVEDEGRLRNFLIRERFLCQLFAQARFRLLEPSTKALVRFQAENKYLLLAYNERVMRDLGRIVANPERKPVARVRAEYGRRLPAAFDRPAKYTAAINVLMHALGYFRDQLNSAEKAMFLDTLERYRRGRIPLSVPTAVLRSWIARFDQPYLAAQTFFGLYPDELVTISDSGKGRDG